MSFLSVFAGISAIFSTAFIGLWIKKRLIRKATFFEDYYAYILYATDKISYERMPLSELNEGFSRGKSGDFIDFLQGAEKNLPISDESLRGVSEYLSKIGTTDAETQVVSLKGKCAELKRVTETDCVKYRKDGALYFKLCVLFGAVLFIILA